MVLVWTTASQLSVSGHQAFTLARCTLTPYRRGRPRQHQLHGGLHHEEPAVQGRAVHPPQGALSVRLPDSQTGAMLSIGRWVSRLHSSHSLQPLCAPCFDIKTVLTGADCMHMPLNIMCGTNIHTHAHTKHNTLQTKRRHTQTHTQAHAQYTTHNTHNTTPTKRPRTHTHAHTVYTPQ